MGLSKLLWSFVLAVSMLALPADTPEGTIREFLEAWNNRNYSKAATYVVGGKPKMNFSSMDQIFQGMTVAVTDVQVTAKGDRANATYQAKMEMPGQQPTVQSESIDLVKVDDDWLIVPASQSSSGRDVLPTLAMMTTNDLTGVFASAKKAAKKTACLSNIKQLATAVMIYLADHDDRFTMNPSKLKAALNPYTKNDNLWICPLTPKSGAAYGFNAKLLKKTSTDIEDPFNTVMMYEGSKGKLDFKHAGYAAVAFADGHAKMVNAEASKKLRWNP